MLNHHRGGLGEPLVLMHGIGSRWQVWSPVLETLERERDVIALDLPGFGASPMAPHEQPRSLETLTDSVVELLDELSLERPHVAGNSLGGWLALELAKRGRASSVTALSPAGFFRNRFEREFTRVPPADAADTIRAASDAPSFNETLAALVGERFTGGEQIDVPVTIAWGELDRLLLPREAARAAQLVPSARSIWLYDCGHLPQYDDPEQVARVLIEGSAA
jgi:pimeloyl-ACP methyl ester carboxylesterase